MAAEVARRLADRLRRECNIPGRWGREALLDCCAVRGIHVETDARTRTEALWGRQGRRRFILLCPDARPIAIAHELGHDLLAEEAELDGNRYEHDTEEAICDRLAVLLAGADA